jgi:hypothetical protein
MSTDASLSGTTAANTNWSTTTPGLPDGTYTVHVKTWDIAGNEVSNFTTQTFVVNSGTGVGLVVSILKLKMALSQETWLLSQT